LFKKLAMFIGAAKTTTKSKSSSKKKLKLDDLVGKKFWIQDGSQKVKSSNPWEKNELIEKIKNTITSTFVDFDFFYNYIDDERPDFKKAFNKSILEPFIKNIDKTLNKYFEYNEVGDNFMGQPELKIKDNFNKRKFLNDWFLKEPLVTSDLKNKYIKYRKDYANETIGGFLV